MSVCPLTVVCGAALLLLEDEGAADAEETVKSSCVIPLLSRTLGSETKPSVLVHPALYFARTTRRTGGLI